MRIRVRTCLEKPWKALNFECIFKALKILENLCSSFLVLESPWIFFWPAFLIFENFSGNNQPLKSCHTNVHYFHLCMLRKMRKTISIGKFIDVNKKEVLKISKFGPWKSLNFWSEKVCEPWRIYRWDWPTLLAEPFFCLLNFGILEKKSAWI